MCIELFLKQFPISHKRAVWLCAGRHIAEQLRTLDVHLTSKKFIGMLHAKCPTDTAEGRAACSHLTCDKAKALKARIDELKKTLLAFEATHAHYCDTQAAAYADQLKELKEGFALIVADFAAKCVRCHSNPKFVVFASVDGGCSS